LSKKVLSSAVARNRVKRLLWEVFRRRSENFPQIDLNVLGAGGLTKAWKSLDYMTVNQQFEAFERYLRGAKADE
jgi:ribonuclease P protein component